MNSPFLFGVGIDVEYIHRFEKISDDFCCEIFTEKEKAYCLSSKFPARHFAVRFCAKEAVVKALSSLGMYNFSYKDIEILKQKDGRPYVNEDFIADVKFSLSLSHNRDIAVASVWAVKGV